MLGTTYSPSRLEAVEIGDVIDGALQLVQLSALSALLRVAVGWLAAVRRSICAYLTDIETAVPALGASILKTCSDSLSLQTIGIA